MNPPLIATATLVITHNNLLYANYAITKYVVPTNMTLQERDSSAMLLSLGSGSENSLRCMITR